MGLKALWHRVNHSSVVRCPVALPSDCLDRVQADECAVASGSFMAFNYGLSPMKSSMGALCGADTFIWDDYITAMSAQRPAHHQVLDDMQCGSSAHILLPATLESSDSLPSTDPQVRGTPISSQAHAKAQLSSLHRLTSDDPDMIPPGSLSSPDPSGSIPATNGSELDRHCTDTGPPGQGADAPDAPVLSADSLLEADSTQVILHPRASCVQSQPASGVFEEADVHREAGLAARARQRYTQAVEHYTAAIEVRVHSCTYNATLYNERADVYYRMGQHIMAIADCYMSKALDPFSALPICMRGRSFKALGYYSLAIKDLLTHWNEGRCVHYMLRDSRIYYARLGKVDQPDRHKVLGVPQYAQPSHISKAYRQLALRFHPDRAVGQAARMCAEVVCPMIKYAHSALQALHVPVAQDGNGEANDSSNVSSRCNDSPQCSRTPGDSDRNMAETAPTYHGAFAAVGLAMSDLCRKTLKRLWKQASYVIVTMARLTMIIS